MGRGRNGPQLVTDELTEVAKRDRPTVDAQGRKLAESIEGVIFERLAPLADHRGSLLPFLDVRDEFWSEPVVYGYEIMIRPGRIKGWGMHEQQTDRYLVATGHVRIALYDGRPDQESHGRIAEFFFTEATPGLLAIPPGFGTPTRTGARRMRTSSTFRRIPTTMPLRTNSGSTPAPT